ncbi:hypothetical protein Tco_0761623 [Tanacetum coccineum]
MEEDLYERIMILNEKRPIIKTLKYSDKHKKVLYSVQLNKLKIDREFKLEEEMVGEELIKDVPVDQNVPIIVGRSFIYACGEIMNTIKGKMTTFDGFVHQQYDVVKLRTNHTESDSDDDEDYYLKRDEMGKPFYGPNRANLCWKKAISFLGALPVPLKHTEWAPNYSGNNTNEDGDGKWNVKIRVMDPYGNVFEQGYETKATKKKASECYKLSDIMSPNWL